jgi:hypothetical protein
LTDLAWTDGTLGATNAYSYVVNNPLGFVDPDGLMYIVCPTKGASGGCTALSDQQMGNGLAQGGGNFKIENGRLMALVDGEWVDAGSATYFPDTPDSSSRNQARSDLAGPGIAQGGGGGSQSGPTQQQQVRQQLKSTCNYLNNVTGIAAGVGGLAGIGAAIPSPLTPVLGAFSGGSFALAATSNWMFGKYCGGVDISGQ